MVYKFIKKQAVYEIIMNEIKKYYPLQDLDNIIVQRNFIENIVKDLVGTKYGYKSVIVRIIKRDVSFKKFFENGNVSEKRKHNELKNVLLELHRQSQGDKSLSHWRSSQLVYKDLCTEMKWKNSLKNRKKAFSAWKSIRYC